MAADRDLVFVSFFAKPGSAASNSCDAIHTQLKPFCKIDSRFKVWDRSLIPAGSDKADAINVALGRCRIAVVLVTPEYLVSEHWVREAEPLLAAAKKREILLLWQQISPSNCEIFEINDLQPLLRDHVLTKVSLSRRNELEQKISRLVFDSWNEFAPVSQHLAALPIEKPGPAALLKAPERTPSVSVALVITPSGEIKEATRYYQWMALIQRIGEEQFQAIPNDNIGADPSFTKQTLPELLKRLQRWINSELEDVPVLEIFAPDDLLEEDWGGMSMGGGEEPRLLQAYQPYLLRSTDRLLNREWNSRRGALMRMHQHLANGTGAWLPEKKLTELTCIKTLDGEVLDHEGGRDVISAICCLQSNIPKNKSNWLQSVLESMAPLVVWPSQKCSLEEAQLQSCLRHLSLSQKHPNLGDKVERPHCPDLVRLAKSRQKWTDPTIDLRGLSILVDHPVHGPDRTTLQALFSPAREDTPRAPEGERPGVQPTILISS